MNRFEASSLPSAAKASCIYLALDIANAFHKAYTVVKNADVFQNMHISSASYCPVSGDARQRLTVSSRTFGLFTYIGKHSGYSLEAQLALYSSQNANEWKENTNIEMPQNSQIHSYPRPITTQSNISENI